MLCCSPTPEPTYAPVETPSPTPVPTVTQASPTSPGLTQYISAADFLYLLCTDSREMVNVQTQLASQQMPM